MKPAKDITLQRINVLDDLGCVHAAYTLGDNNAWPMNQRNFRAQYEAVASELGLCASDMVRVEQRHTAEVKVVQSEDAGEGVVRRNWDKAYDGIVTDAKEVVLSVNTADCTPVFLVDPSACAIGLVHSGWRGTVGKISANALKIMQQKYGCNAANIVAYIGPHICTNCFEFGKDDTYLLGDFACRPYVKDAGCGKKDKVLVDTSACIKDTLLECGLNAANIYESDSCSFESADTLASYRRDHNKARTLSVFALC